LKQILLNIFDPAVWRIVPFHFWTAAVFVFGTMVGSFLNVCIHRMPLDQSVVTPPSHCPKCKYSIPWFFNIPIITWLVLRGRCANCKDSISPRYLLVELLTGLAFAAAWVRYGRFDVGVALSVCLLLAIFIGSSFIDFEHFIIPDEFTKGGTVAGIVCSILVPALHQSKTITESLKLSVIGALVGAGVVYAILRLGKLAFGRETMKFENDTTIVFSETAVRLPSGELAYSEVFARKSDTIHFHATRIELPDRCYWDKNVRLSPEKLMVGDDEFRPDDIPLMSATTSEIILPREAMGLGDVKFMAAIGAFLGWKSVLFSLTVSSILGSVVGLTLVLMKKKEMSGRIPYGPYIAAAAVIWIFGGHELVARYLR